MSRLQDRTWYVLPTPRKMIWRYNCEDIAVTVIAFSFDGDMTEWLTVNSVVIAGVELRDGGES